jgi:hypothetical protein
METFPQAVLPLDNSSSTNVDSSNSRGLPRPLRAYTTAGTEMSARNRRPTTGRASAVRSPRFGNAKVRVAVALMQGSAELPVVVSRPLCRPESSGVRDPGEGVTAERIS